MVKRLTVIYTYYNSPQMLRVHLFNWSMLPDDMLKRVLFILADDGSRVSPALPVLKQFGEYPFQLRLYRAIPDIPWNQHGCRNLAAREAPDGWLFLSDIDHTLPQSSLKWLLEHKVYKDRFYTFRRMTRTPGGKVVPMIDSRNGKPKPHPNTYLLPKRMYWDAGGYDEDYCGTYGGDGPFRRALNKVGFHEHLKDPYIVRWPREVIPDASQQPEFREKYRGLYEPKFRAKGGGGLAEKPGECVRFEWERQL